MAEYPELTVQLLRPAEGVWICLDARSLIGEAGIGMAESALYDERGCIGAAAQSLLVDARLPPAGLRSVRPERGREAMTERTVPLRSGRSRRLGDVPARPSRPSANPAQASTKVTPDYRSSRADSRSERNRHGEGGQRRANYTTESTTMAMAV